MKKIFLKISIVLLLLSPSLALAAPITIWYPGHKIVPDCGETANYVGDISSRACDFNDLLQLANNVIAFLFWAAVPISLLLFAYAGWLLLVTGYDPGNVATAKKIFWDVIWGLVFMAGAWLLVYVITDTLLKERVTSSPGFFLKDIR